MNRLQVLKAALAGSASVVTLLQPAAAKSFDVPAGDLSTALVAYIKQSDATLIYADSVVRGHKSRGAKGDLTETAALTQVLKGTGFAAQTMPMNTIAIVPAPSAPKSLQIEVAQATPRKAPTSVVETVVVTAQKKSENIQQVPIAVTALTQQQLTERQVAGGPDLVKEVPNLTFSKTNFSGYNLEIRGIGTQAISVTTDPAVAVAFNDIPFIRNHFFEQEFYDLQDAEVLRGPQGTLYGRNATAGVVNIKSALPTDQYGAMLSADIGNYSNRRLEAMLNLPIVGDTLDLRIAGEWTKRDGYTEDTTLGTPVDGRDLWSGRVTLGWKPASNVQAYLVWEHFSEDDDRLRSGKQLCKTAPIPATVNGVSTTLHGPLGSYYSPGDSLSQGCEDVSLYSPQAFEVPNGFSLPYYSPLTGDSAPVQQGIDPYASTTQSTNLRDIQSALLPHYRAKNDTVELRVDWNFGADLSLTSESGYNHDYLLSTEDYDRFDSTPGMFTYVPGFTLPDPVAGTGGVPANSGIFCDPQLGCSDKLMVQDLNTEHAWQFSQEFRLASKFDGPLNFSFGANYLHYETEENYYVFINTVSLFSLWVNRNANGGIYQPGITNNSACLPGSFRYTNYSNFPVTPQVLGCGYVDPNPLASVNGEGHNYFLSQNPYVLNSYAAFGELYYDITNDLKLTSGLRFTDDQKHFDIIPSELLIPGYGYPETGQTNQQWDQFTGRSVLDWTPDLGFTDQSLFYASYAHGYKAGGTNPPGAFYPGIAGITSASLNPIHPLTFKPEFIEAFELGTKNTALNNTLTLNGDIFYYNYSHYQISEIVDRTAINNNYNAHVEGAEFEANWEPLPGLKFSLAQGFENSGLASGEQGIDLMDRTAGMPGWMVVKPSVTVSSNCILPAYVVAAGLQSGLGNFNQMCSDAYASGLDPITGLPYVQNPSVTSHADTIPAGYPGFDPSTAPNNGEGFAKNLSGHQLPNAPHFTTSLTAEYSMPVSDDWLATFHSDFYWQSQSWARVFDDAIDKIHGYSNVNLALTLTSANGWQVMGYVKNVFNVTAITGTFLNSDDTGLTTNVFLTDPRLFGIRVTKQLDQNDGFWGSDYSGADFFTGLFSDADNGNPPLWVELGGQLAVLDASQQPFVLPFTPDYARGQSPVQAEKLPRLGFDEEAKITFQPVDTDWVILAGLKFGRANSSMHQHLQTANKAVPVHFSFYGHSVSYTAYPSQHVKFSDATTSQSESHTVVDFLVGKEVGLGMFGMPGSSVLSGGVRVAQFVSKSNLDLHAEPDVQYPTTPATNFVEKYQFAHSHIRFHDYEQMASRKETFAGLGPKLDWRASTPLADELSGALTFDWGADFAMLFGRQKTREQQRTQVQSYYLNHWTGGNLAKSGGTLRPGVFINQTNGCGNAPVRCLPTNHHTNVGEQRRSRMVAVPNLGGFLGLSWKYQNAKVSFGYRADEFFGVLDGGIGSRKTYNRGFNGPYATVSIGLGG